MQQEEVYLQLKKEKMRGKQLPLLRELTFSLLLAFSLLS
jgi:hypothetical protein